MQIYHIIIVIVNAYIDYNKAVIWIYTLGFEYICQKFLMSKNIKPYKDSELDKKHADDAVISKILRSQ